MGTIHEPSDGNDQQHYLMGVISSTNRSVAIRSPGFLKVHSERLPLSSPEMLSTHAPTTGDPQRHQASSHLAPTLPADSPSIRTSPMSLHQGDCIHLASDSNLYQVIAVDPPHDRCWVRRWPLAREGSPVFEVSLQQVHNTPPSLALHGQPSL